MGLIVNLEELAELVGITPETMRVHLRAVEGQPDWLIKRGDRGRGYRIDAEGAVAWFQAKQEGDDLANEERRLQLAQLRLELIGPQGAEAEQLTLSARQRRDEYAAVLERIKLRREMGALVERADLEHVLTGAAVELRRRIRRVPGEFAIISGLSHEVCRPLDTLLGRAIEEFLTAIGAGGEDDHAAN